MLCLGGSLLYAIVTVLQEIMLKTHSCTDYLALLGFIGSVLSCSQTFFLEFGELLTFNWYEIETIVQLGSYCGVQTIFQILQSFMLRDAGSIILHLSFLSADYYTLIAGMYIFQFKVNLIFLITAVLILSFTKILFFIFHYVLFTQYNCIEPNTHVKIVPMILPMI